MSYATLRHDMDHEARIFVASTSTLSAPMEIKQTWGQKLKSIDYLDYLSAFAMLAIMYVLFGGFFVGMLEAAEAIRGENYRVLPAKYFGSFQKGTNPAIPNGVDAYPPGFWVPWNSTLFQ